MISFRILNHRPNDEDGTDGFMAWPFTTSQLWGENPRGLWTISAKLNPESELNQIGMVVSVKLILYGTKEAPYIKEVLPPNVCISRKGNSLKFFLKCTFKFVNILPADELARVKRAEETPKKHKC